MALKNAESGHRSKHARILSDIQPSKISLGDRQCGLRASVRYSAPDIYIRGQPSSPGPVTIFSFFLQRARARVVGGYRVFGLTLYRSYSRGTSLALRLALALEGQSIGRKKSLWRGAGGRQAVCAARAGGAGRAVGR